MVLVTSRPRTGQLRPTVLPRASSMGLVEHSFLEVSSQDSLVQLFISSEKQDFWGDSGQSGPIVDQQFACKFTVMSGGYTGTLAKGCNHHYSNTLQGFQTQKSCSFAWVLC